MKRTRLMARRTTEQFISCPLDCRARRKRRTKLSLKAACCRSSQGNGTPALELIDRGLPLVAHPVEFLLGVYLVDGELVDPFPDLRFVVEDLTAEEPVLARGDKRRYLSGRTREHH